MCNTLKTSTLACRNGVEDADAFKDEEEAVNSSDDKEGIDNSCDGHMGDRWVRYVHGQWLGACCMVVRAQAVVGSSK